MEKEVERLKQEVSQLANNYAFLVEYYKTKIRDKRNEKQKLINSYCMPHCSGIFCWFTAKHLDDTPVPLMLDDSVGALTRSVYDSSADTAKSFGKLVPVFHELESKLNEFSTHLTSDSEHLQSEILRSVMHAKRALGLSKQITNGSSDSFSSDVINTIIARLGLLQKHIVLSVKTKNILSDLIETESRHLTHLGRTILGSSQKSFSVMSVSDKICANAKLLQTLSKSAVDRAERSHLAAASSDIHGGVGQVAEIVRIEKEFIPIKPVNVNAVIPVNFGLELDKAFTHTNSALEHAEKALLFSGAARAREVVDCRDELRSVLDHEQNALAVKQETTDFEITRHIIPGHVRITKLVSETLLPKLDKFKIVNDQILRAIDRNHSITIDEQLTRKVAKQSRVIGSIVLAKKQKWKAFL